jgi:hypothetical protein
MYRLFQCISLYDSVILATSMKFILSDVKVSDAEQISRQIEVPAMRKSPLHQLMFPSYNMFSLEQTEEVIRWYTVMLEDAFTDRWESFLKATDVDGTPYGFCGWTVVGKVNDTAKTATSVDPDVQRGSQQKSRYQSRSKIKRNNWVPETLDVGAWTAVSQALRAERNRVLQDLSNICR